MKFANGFRLAAAALVIAGLTAPAFGMSLRTGATLRALDKVTGTTKDFTVQAGQSATFGRISVTLRACYGADQLETPESSAFVEIRSLGPAPNTQGADKDGAKSKGKSKIAAETANEMKFSGWMYASSPGLNGLEHPTYDVWVISCTGPEPQILPPADQLPPAGTPAPTPTPGDIP
jgi:hypothetical protein